MCGVLGSEQQAGTRKIQRKKPQAGNIILYHITILVVISTTIAELGKDLKSAETLEKKNLSKEKSSNYGYLHSLSFLISFSPLLILQI